MQRIQMKLVLYFYKTSFQKTIVTDALNQINFRTVSYKNKRKSDSLKSSTHKISIALSLPKNRFPFSIRTLAITYVEIV